MTQPVLSVRDLRVEFVTRRGILKAIDGISFDIAPGETLVLVNDHDPKPLYYQFKAESSAEFTWDYLESGPEVWRVAIGKAGAAPTAVAHLGL